jgi:hypothetical protein
MLIALLEMDDMPTDGPHDKNLRKHPRRRRMAGVTCRWQRGGEHHAVLVNVSSGGVRLMVRMVNKPPPLARIAFHRRDEESLEISARTVYSERRNGLWLLGCTFDRELSENEFQELLPSDEMP